ncbi:transglutaminase-like domain-containing protein [Bacillus benzoevorans]|uniref:Transglutaminase-like putative cysteine protease n=1 Tax=Bacillus benzoevorans TaxID=1456 RepID=A0A7X0LYL9_9BACI|nr:transglutaminase family protein [Bacillus benzoevorans]MBB6447657.1 transglutaminase-like putative cysteine protease [Bacillus benzoevorans]
MRYHHGFASFLLYCFGFVLVTEWIWPVKVLTDTANIWVFIVFLAVSFLLTYLGTPLIWSLAAKGMVIMYLLHWLYFEGSFLQLDWVMVFFQDIQQNIAFIFSANIPEVSNLFRSLLLFILLWLMTYLLHYWLIQRRRILLFFIMTIAYITVLDTFTPYEAANSIVRTVIIGFLCLGVLLFYRMRESEGMDGGFTSFRKWLFPLAVLLSLSVMLGFALPKQAPIWPDPVPYMQGLSSQTEGNQHAAVQRVGYGTDDSRLGGPFTGDSTVVFRTEVESSHYWKVETKDVYTGKGWIQSIQDAEAISFSQNSDTPVSSFAARNTRDKKAETSFVYQLKDYPHIIYPLGVKSIQSDYHAEFKFDPALEKIYSVDDSQSVALPSYSVTFEKAAYQKSDLTSVENASGISRDFMNRYTQLPETIPHRVRELAEEITAGKDNWFDQAKAIEQYLQGSHFSYDTKDVQIPGKNEDYVDQFLFESRRGYCDNFSSSMAALLRSIDIPARWVKGYTAGEFNGSNRNLQLYEITNDNAHSWVEVYFPDAGWVSFEPTPGFSNHVSFQSDEQGKNPAENTEPTPEKDAPKQEAEQPLEKTKTEEDHSSEQIWHNWKGAAERSWKWFAAAGITAAVLVLLLFRFRVKWLPYYYIWRFKRAVNDESFPEAYVILLKQLQRCGLKRNKGQTLREYALMIDKHFSTDEMTMLTVRYEQYLYGTGVEMGSWSEMMELWEYLIKRTIA